MPTPAPFSNLLLDTPAAPSGLVSSEEFLRRRASVSGNDYRPASAGEKAQQNHSSCRRSLPQSGTVAAALVVGCGRVFVFSIRFALGTARALSSTTRPDAPDRDPACITWLSRAQRPDARLAVPVNRYARDRNFSSNRMRVLVAKLTGGGSTHERRKCASCG